MNKLERRKITRRARELANRRAKFIETYIRAKHVKVYEEADRVYKNIEKNNKGKKDLRKTSEFLLLTTKYKNIRQYYDRPNRTTATKQYPDNMVLSKQYQDTMVLNIPLMNLSTPQDPPQPLPIPDVPETTDRTLPPQPLPIPDVSETTDRTLPPQPLPIPDVSETTDRTLTPQPLLIPDVPETTDRTLPPQPLPIPDVSETTDRTLTPQPLLIPDVPETTDRTLPPLPPIPDHMYQQLLNEIRNDPELNLIFNDMSLGDDSIPPSDDDIMDLSEIGIELQTPLEIELANIC